MRLSEYMDTIRGVIVSVQENESVCVSFVESMPSYADLTNWQDFSVLQKMEYIWYKDEVQTARILFYLRVIPTCIECVTAPIFRQVLVPTMFLYMGHPNKKVARASHSMFVGFISSGKDSDQDERVSLKEKLVFYYIERSLAEYPGTTPFKGMASGVVALVRHLPTGSPAIFYCINSFVVLSNLMKLLAQLIMKLPKDGQNLVLNELFSLVVESDDVTRKPTLVSWLQSLSYLCSQDTSRVANSTEVGGDKNSVSAQATNSSDLHARL
ncbi:Obscurin-like protein [Citrus sinensis]|nr:Obscurin-like protein [Citrus sinensis]